MPLLRGLRFFWLAATLAVRAQAGVVRGPAPVYASPSGAWAAPLGAAFADPALSGLIPPSLAAPNLSVPEALRAASPLVQHLAQSLKLTPEKFAALPVSEKKAVLELASDAAREELRATIDELAENARDLSSRRKGLDREGRAELYGTVARLMEVRDHYGAWLAEAELAAVEENYRLASTRAWEIRNLLIGEAAAPLGVAAPPAAARSVVQAPSAAARRLREDMKRSKNGWGQNDLDTLYTGYGFVLRQGGKHRFYSHPDFPQLHASVSRQNDLPPGYAQSALKLIAELERLSTPAQIAASAAAGPPATLTLADLSVLLSPPAAKIATPKPVLEESKPRAPPKIRIALHHTPAPAANPTKLAPPTAREPIAKTETPAPAPAFSDKPVGLFKRLQASWQSLLTLSRNRSLAKNIPAADRAWVIEQGFLDPARKFTLADFTAINAFKAAHPEDETHQASFYDKTRSAGKLRTEEVTSGGMKTTPAQNVPTEMNAFIRWLNDSDGKAVGTAVETLAAEAFLRLIILHPFEDANGRTARLLLNILLLRHNRPAIRFDLLDWDKGPHDFASDDVRYLAFLIQEAQTGRSMKGWKRYSERVGKVLSSRELEHARHIPGGDFLDWINGYLMYDPPSVDGVAQLHAKANLTPEQDREFLRLLDIGARRAARSKTGENFERLKHHFSSYAKTAD